MERDIQGFSQRPYDVLVIGGGINGAAVAHMAALNGLKVALLEKGDFASGTSGRSTKLIHGGLRYLEGFDFSLVHESLKERAIIRKIAPELVHLRPFHIPVYPQTSRRPVTLRVGLSLYALLGGLRASARFRTLDRSEWDELDGLETNNLQAVFQYYDAQTNDSKLTHAVMQSAMDHGAILNCPAEFMSANLGEKTCEINYRNDGADKTCTCAAVINATGPWVNDVARRIT
ncbi:MAG: FAD-dependent oxidoreductase, partial [Candidatus Omnitrophica bacterium]|nr:FAD-dependent oxidoreductase [Candidatus Omnitrophota bacterium]